MRADEVCDPEQTKLIAKRRRGRLETSNSITELMSESMERITRDTQDRAEWRKLVLCAARAAILGTRRVPV